MLFAAVHESAIGPKRTWASALHMSAFGGKADMTSCGYPLSPSQLGVKRTWVGAPQMSAYDPKRTSENTHFVSLSEVKRTWVGALHMSAFDSKRTLAGVTRDRPRS
jgi:hypothetical protein